MLDRQGRLASWWIGATLLVALLCVPAPAGAASASIPFLSGFETTGTDGYRISLVTLSNQVWLEASSGRVGATYIVRGHIREGTIRARFGSLGRVAMRIRGVRELGDGDCLRERVIRADGTFRFRGELGYTQVRKRSLRGFQLLFDRSCFAGASAAERATSGLPEVRLTAISRTKHRVTSVRALRGQGQGKAILRAQVSERRPRMRILRAARVRLGGEHSLLTSVPGEGRPTATLRPPKPFAGTATLSNLGPGTSSWTGDMTVWLPGLDRVPLAGDRYAASLCLRPPGKGSCPAEPPVDRPPSRPQAIRTLP